MFVVDKMELTMPSLNAVKWTHKENPGSVGAKGHSLVFELLVYTVEVRNFLKTIDGS